jgi:tRNA (guanine26-N2/guanine27-N2)-dimethyltransferase
MASDRDLNVAVVRAWRSRRPAAPLGWEMLAATGARGLRLVHEAGGFASFELTEHDPEAVELLQRNAAQYASEGAHAQRHDARVALGRAAFDYVDLDPYGTPMPYLDAALDAVRPGGLLAVTATDTRVLAGVQAGVAERRYGGRPIRGRLGPEAGLRLLLAAVERTASHRAAHIVPRLAYVGDHHVRAYLEIQEGLRTSPEVALLDSASWDGPTLRPPGRYGPMWLGPLFDPELIGALTVPPSCADLRRTAQVIAVLQEECSVDRPFYYETNVLARELQLTEPPSPTSMIAELRRQGRRAAPTHARPGAFRTDAPHREVGELARAVSAQSQKDRVRA